jgi:hypothetical protein
MDNSCTFVPAICWKHATIEEKKKEIHIKESPWEKLITCTAYCIVEGCQYCYSNDKSGSKMYEIIEYDNSTSTNYNKNNSNYKKYY